MIKTTETLRAELLELGHSLAAQARAALSKPQTSDMGAYIQHLSDSAAGALEAAAEVERRAKQEEVLDRLVDMFAPLVTKYIQPSTAPHTVS